MLLESNYALTTRSLRQSVRRSIQAGCIIPSLFGAKWRSLRQSGSGVKRSKCIIKLYGRNIYRKVENIDYPSAGFAGRRIMDFWDLSIDMSLEVQNQKYNWILYLLDYIAPGLQFQYNFEFSPKITQHLLKSRFTNKKPVRCFGICFRPIQPWVCSCSNTF